MYICLFPPFQPGLFYITDVHMAEKIQLVNKVLLDCDVSNVRNNSIFDHTPTDC